VTISTLLENLGAAGIRLRSVGGELRVGGNRHALDSELVGQLRSHKAALLEIVTAEGDDWWSPPRPSGVGDGLSADNCIHALFEAQVERTPDAVAVVFEGEQLTYAELNARANRLAHHLRGRGVGPEVAVGVCLEWRPELVAALLATLKAGGVYVPLDPALPAERLAYMAEDAGVRALVTRAALAERVPSGAIVLVDADAEQVCAEGRTIRWSPASARRTWRT
jgi:non-ribosomal peptide synthetase component F